MSQLVGQDLHCYRITRAIGHGGMGTVYEAIHLRLGKRRFALKVLRADVAELEQVYARFRREAEITSELGHPHIVDVVDFNETEEGQPYIVMEYLEGEDLGRRIDRDGRLSLAEVAQVMRQTGAALQAAHDHGVVHRDLKPDNIFLVRGADKPIWVKVLDFGISKVRDSQSIVTKDHTVFGTPQYMAPEQAEGTVDCIDHRTDIFALGAITYHALSGTLPFEAPTVPGILYRVRHEEPEPLCSVVDGLPESVERVVSRAMAKARDDRYERVQDFVSELAACSEQEAGTDGAPEAAASAQKVEILVSAGPQGVETDAEAPAPPAAAQRKTVLERPRQAEEGSARQPEDSDSSQRPDDSDSSPGHDEGDALQQRGGSDFSQQRPVPGRSRWPVVIGSIVGVIAVAVAAVVLTGRDRVPAVGDAGSQPPPISAGRVGAAAKGRGERAADARAAEAGRAPRPLRILDPAGIAISKHREDERTPAVACSDVNCLVVWSTRTAIRAARVSGARAAVLDPRPITLSSGADQHDQPAVACDGSGYFVVWRRARPNGYLGVRGARVTKKGSVLDPAPGVDISGAQPNLGQPSISFGGRYYLVAWSDERAGGSNANIYARRVDSSGARVGEEVRVALAGGHQRSPQVAYNGTSHLVVWNDERVYARAQTDVYGAEISGAGAILATFAVRAGAGDQGQARSSCNRSSCLVSWRDFASRSAQAVRLARGGIVLDDPLTIHGHDALASDNTAHLAVGTREGNIHAVRVGAKGKVLDPEGVAISLAPGHQERARAAFDGRSYLVVWQDKRNGDRYDIYGARVVP